MTDAPAPPTGPPADADKFIWEAAERGRPAEIAEHRDEPHHRLLRVLAHQNASEFAKAAELARLAMSLPFPFGSWAKAELGYAARARASVTLSPDDVITPADALALARAGEPWAKLAAGRAYLALGLMATEDNRLAEADTLLAEALRLLHGAESESGQAVAHLELGKLRAWQGRADDAFTHLLSGLSIWRDLNEARSTETWQQIGSLLLDGRNYEQAVAVLQSAWRHDPSPRTRNALTRALLGCGRLDDAESHARALVASEAALRTAQTPGHDSYREMMARYDLGLIALARRNASLLNDVAERSEAAADELEQAEEHFREALALHGARTNVNDSLFSTWIGPLDKESRAPAEGKGLGFRQLRLVQLELMIAAQKRPGEAARNLAKLADVFGRRGEPIQELEAREQSAQAFERAGDPLQAAQAYEQAMRSAELSGAVATARAMRRDLARALASIGRFGRQRDGYLLRGVERRFPHCIVLAATNIETGQRARIYEFSVSPALTERSAAGLSALGAMYADSRVLPGLPVLLSPPPARVPATGSFDIITDAVEGETLSAAMTASRGDWRRAVRVVRDISYAVGILRNAGMADCRPAPDSVLLDLGDSPLCIDILPLRVGATPSESDEVRHLASLLAEWISGEKPRVRSIALGAGQKRLIFGDAYKGPPGLNVLLSTMLLGKPGASVTAADFANQLQAFCS
jgi:tetratricopeptide (TPR) repeat protein